MVRAVVDCVACVNVRSLYYYTAVGSKPLVRLGFRSYLAWDPHWSKADALRVATHARRQNANKGRKTTLVTSMRDPPHAKGSYGASPSDPASSAAARGAAGAAAAAPAGAAAGAAAPGSWACTLCISRAIIAGSNAGIAPPPPPPPTPTPGGVRGSPSSIESSCKRDKSCGRMPCVCSV